MNAPAHTTEQIEPLGSEINTFVSSFKYWAKFISSKILSNNSILDIELDEAYSYFLEDENLKERTERPEIIINHSCNNSDIYKTDLILSKLSNTKGVNALIEGESVEFHPNITVIYGENGSGKTGYVRLLKKAFFSRAEENILNNIYVKSGHKEASANFEFLSENQSYTLKYPEEKERAEFKQYAVFCGKSVLVHLNKKNEFEFRPAGLNFFAELTSAYKRIEEKIDKDIKNKSISINYTSLFDGESDIRILIQNISSGSIIEDLKKHLPFTDDDRQNKIKLEERKATLVTLKKDSEIKNLEEIKRLLNNVKQSIELNNKHFTVESISKINRAINICIAKESSAKDEGIENFKSELFSNIGSSEWKYFIESAGDFVKKQEKSDYPEEGDHCIFCHQELSEEAQQLIKKYWVFIKSQAEVEAKNALESLRKIKSAYERLNFALFPEDGILTKWLNEKHPDTLKHFNNELSSQRTLSDSIVLAIANKDHINKVEEKQIAVTSLDAIIANIGKEIESLKKEDHGKELEAVGKQITYLAHKEKLEQHIDKIEGYINNLKWAAKADNAKRQLNSRKITTKEKELSAKYFNKSYLTAFKNECNELNGNFGINVECKGETGTSYRKLNVGSRTPSDVLSEGEQKVISLADFLAEIKLSEVNKGIIFDDPVNSLDNERKSDIARRLVAEGANRQVVIFTHDLVFLSSIMGYCDDFGVSCDCHWMERVDGKPGRVWLRNTPAFENKYKKSGKAQEFLSAAKNCGPEERETNIKSGFAALRTSYEAMVVFDLFNGVVQRFKERVSVDSLRNVYFNSDIRDEILDSFSQCCRYMEGHSHSDEYAYKKPELQYLRTEVCRFDKLKNKLKELKKSN